MFKLIHNALDFGKSEEEILKREQEAIEAKFRLIERQRFIVKQFADLRDKLPEAENIFALKIKEVEPLLTFPVEKIHESFCAGLITAEQWGERLGAIEAGLKHVAKLKQFAHKYFVEAAEAKVKAFEKENADVLKGVKLVPAAEPKFVPANLPPDHYTGDGSKKLTATCIK